MTKFFQGNVSRIRYVIAWAFSYNKIVLCPDLFPFQQVVGWSLAHFGLAVTIAPRWLHCEARHLLLSSSSHLGLLFPEKERSTCLLWALFILKYFYSVLPLPKQKQKHILCCKYNLILKVQEQQSKHILNEDKVSLLIYPVCIFQ